MATFSPISKSTEANFTKSTKNTDAWENVQHSDVEGAGFDIQSFDDPSTGFDQPGNVIITIWTITNKETG